MLRSIVFDLDNTLFLTKGTTIWDQMSVKAAYFISREFEVGYDLALADVRAAPLLYGSSVRMYTDKYGGGRVQELIDCMHDVDLSEVKSSDQLRAGLQALDTYAIYLYTNGARGYARKMLSLLNVDDCFIDIFCLEDAAFMSKPSFTSFEEMVKQFGVVGSSTVCVDDCSGTLGIARLHGFETAHISNEVDSEHTVFSNILDFIEFEKNKLPVVGGGGAGCPN